MQARGRLVISILLIMILAPWIGAIDAVERTPESELSQTFPELNEAQVDAILSTGARGVTTWVKQGTADPSASNGPGDINSVWISDVINTSNSGVIIAGSYRGDVIFDGGPTPTVRDERTAFVAQLDQWGGWSWFKHSGQPNDSVGSAHVEEATIGPAGVWICGWISDTITFGEHSVTTGGLYTDGFAALYNITESTWDIVSSWGGQYDDHANGCTATDEGAIFVVGSFRDTAYFGANQFQSEGSSDMYVLKLDDMGEFSWVQAWGGSYADNVTAITIDDSENAYIVGYYRDNVLDWPSDHILTAGRPYNGFVSKVNPFGTFQWSRDLAGGVNYQSVFSTSVTFGNGDIYVGGYFDGSIDFRNGNSVSLSILANTSAENGYVASIDLAGNWIWATRSSGAADSGQIVQDLSVGPLGTIAVSGYFFDTNEFWTNATFGPFLLTQAAGTGGFVSGLDPYGNWIWADSFGGEMDDVAYAVAWQGLGRILTAGRHCVDLDFGCGSSFGGINKSTYSYIEGAGFIWDFQVDTDLDGIADVDDNCPTVNNTAQADMDSDNLGDLCDDDADSDTLDDYWDDCIGPSINWDQSIWTLDRDGDGCRDSDEDNDDDGDGIPDVSDSCDDYTTRHNWSSGFANDYDGDGCHDSDEDLDDDSDSVLDTDDLCPRQPYNRTWTSSNSNDHDGDGCDNIDDDDDDDNDGVNDFDSNGGILDQCSRGTLDWISDSMNDQDGDGCLDSGEDEDDDDDGVLDFVDDCPYGALNWNSQPETDKDGDGCRTDEDPDDDNDGLLDGDDSCPNGHVGWTSTSSTDIDGDGCRDASDEDIDDDGDKVPDVGDSCPNGKTGWESDATNDADGDGCHDEEEDPDDDNDGFNDGSDDCPGTPSGVTVYEGGCSAEQGDDDSDGIQNYLDDCPDVAAVEGFDPNYDGCTDDIDQDGKTDDVDQCASTPLGEEIDDYGCGLDTQQDLDGDGVLDINEPEICLGTSNQTIRDANLGPESEPFTFDSQFGCWSGDEDDDDDEIVNWIDICPDSIFENIIEIDDFGCDLDQQDEDGDGVPNADDGCFGTRPGAVVVEDGCSRQQLSPSSDEDGLPGFLLILIVSGFFLITGVAIGGAILLKRRKAITSPSLDHIDEIDEEMVENTGENYGDDPNYKVDENGCEWWLDDDQKWWFRTPEMDDWMEHSD